MFRQIIAAAASLLFAVPSAMYGQLFQPRVDYRAGKEPRSVAVGDLNGDAKLDLIIADNYSGIVAVLLGNGDGTFKNRLPFSTGPGPISVAVGDFNRDGKLDVVTANAAVLENTVSILLGNGDGTLQTHVEYPAGQGPFSVAVGDLNRDGLLDLAVANLSDGTGNVLLGNGDGTFQAPLQFFLGYGPTSVAIGDFNRDGIPDLVFSGDYYIGRIYTLLGNGDGTFQPPMIWSSRPSSTAVGTADFNHDGNLDVVAEIQNGVSVFLGKGDGTFSPHQDFQVPGADGFSYSMAIGDFDLDGNADVAVLSTHADVGVLLGNGDGTFKPASTYPTGVAPEGIAAADFNGDGALDLAVANSVANSVSILLNVGPGLR